MSAVPMHVKYRPALLYVACVLGLAAGIGAETHDRAQADGKVASSACVAKEAFGRLADLSAAAAAKASGANRSYLSQASVEFQRLASAAEQADAPC
jgi:hypothetical protein